MLSYYYDRREIIKLSRAKPENVNMCQNEGIPVVTPIIAGQGSYSKGPPRRLVNRMIRSSVIKLTWPCPMPNKPGFAETPSTSLITRAYVVSVLYALRLLSLVCVLITVYTYTTKAV